MQVDIYSIQQAWQAANQDRSLLQDLQARGIQSIDSQLTPPAKANLPQCARSNFPTTYLSLATSMNMNYLQSFGADLIKAGINYEDWGIYAEWAPCARRWPGCLETK